jgi:hypothetical protein
LFADSLEELHKFAARLGLKHSWFCNSPGHLPHYILNSSHRDTALLRSAYNLQGEFGSKVLERLRRQYVSAMATV